MAIYDVHTHIYKYIGGQQSETLIVSKTDIAHVVLDIYFSCSLAVMHISALFL